MKKLYGIFYIGIFIFILLAILLFPQSLSALTKNAVNICLTVIIPSLFPFAVMTQLLSRTKAAYYAGKLLSFVISPIFGIPKELCGCFITGIFGGFPNGAHANGILYNKGMCTKKQAERCIALSNNCSLPFLVSIVGLQSLGSVKNGVILVLSQLISIFIISLILRFDDSKSTVAESVKVNSVLTENDSIPAIICKSITGSCVSMLNICAFVTVFYVISGIITKPFMSNNVVLSLVKGFFEISSGTICASEICFPLNFVICSAIVGFSGLSVIFQVIEVASEYSLSAKEFIYSRLLNAVIMPIVTSLLLLVLPYKSVSVFSHTAQLEGAEPHSLLSTVILYVSVMTIAIAFLCIVYGLSVIAAKKTINKK